MAFYQKAYLLGLFLNFVVFNLEFEKKDNII